MRGSELLIVGLGRALGAALALLGFVVLTRMLPPVEYAMIVLLTAFSSFAGLVLLNPAGQWVSRHIHEWHDRGTLAARLKELLRLVAVASAGVGGFAAVWYLLATEAGIGAAIGVGVAVTALIHFSTAALAFASSLNSLGHRKGAVVWQMAANGLGLLAAVVLVQTSATAIMWLSGLALGAVPAFFGARRELRMVLARPSGLLGREPPTQRTFIFQKDFLNYAYPLAMVTVLMWLEGSGYRFVLERVWSPLDLGLFLMALSVPAQLTAVLESVVTQIAYPYFFRSIASLDDKDMMARLTSTLIGALLPLYWIFGGFLFLLAPQFLFLVAGPDYHGAAEWMVVGVLLEVARLTSNVWLLSAQASKDFRPMTGPFAVGAVGSFFTCLTVAAFDGPVIAVAGGLVAAALTKSIFIVVRARHMLPLRVPLTRIGLAGLLLVAGLAAHGPLAHNYGAWSSLAILLGAGTATLALGYLHLRTARDFHAMLQLKLG